MSDFITLACPSCGGHLAIQKNHQSYKCDYCGVTHQLRQTDIEQSSRCPVCQRNDMVEKVTAIRTRGGTLAQKLHEPLKLDDIDFNNPTKHPDFDEISRKSEVTRNSNTSIMLTVLVGFLTYLFTFISVTIFLDLGGKFFVVYRDQFLWNIGMFILSIILISRLISVHNKRGHWETQKRDLLLEQQKAIAELKNQYVTNYPKLVQKYEKIYYCNRDDIVFIPGEDRYINSSDYEAYLYNV